MSDPKDQLKSMLQDLINDRQEQATMTIHDYIVAKTQEVAGLGRGSMDLTDEDLADLDTSTDDKSQVEENLDQE